MQPVGTTIVKKKVIWIYFSWWLLSIRKDNSEPKLLHMILVRNLESNFYHKYVPKEWIGSDFFHLTNETLANESCSDWIKTQENNVSFMEGEYISNHHNNNNNTEILCTKHKQCK